MEILKKLSILKIRDKFKLLVNSSYSWLLSMTFIKITAIIVVNCFLLTAVYGQAAVMVADGARAATQFKQIFSDFELPYNYGKISAVSFKNSDKIVINIQDLHSHAGVQKNINNIIELFDSRYGVKNVYVEGAYGNVSTKWLTAVKNEDLRNTVIESLLNAGRLTGAEYYSAKSGKTEIIKGLESKSEYLDNLKRFGLIVTNQEILNIYFKEIDDSVRNLQEKYYNRQQKKIENLSKDYVSGNITPKKYFSIMKKYADKLGVDLSSYENLDLYVELMERQKNINYEKTTNELQILVLKLKEELPYGAYKMLLEGTKNFQQMDKLYGYIIKLSRRYNLDITSNFPNLEKFFAYIELTQRINPLELVTEEQNFKDEINDRFAVNRAEEEVIFLSNFVNYYKAYLSGKVTSDDLKYYKNNIEKFKSLWVRYIDNRLIKSLAEYEQTADKFYEINLHRNNYFMLNMNESLSGTENLISVEGTTELEKTMNSLSKAKELYFVVAGGFHTHAISELLSDRNITNIVITPNVQGDTKLAEETYYKIAKEQSKINFQALANLIMSKAYNDMPVEEFLKSIDISLIQIEEKEKDEIEKILMEALENDNVKINQISRNSFSVTKNGKTSVIRLNENNNIDEININKEIIEQNRKEASLNSKAFSDDSGDIKELEKDLVEKLKADINGFFHKRPTSPYLSSDDMNYENDISELSFIGQFKLAIKAFGFLEGIYLTIKQKFGSFGLRNIFSSKQAEKNRINRIIEEAKETGEDPQITLEEILNAYDLNDIYDEYKEYVDLFIKYQVLENHPKKDENDNNVYNESNYIDGYNDAPTQTNVQIAVALQELKGGSVAELPVGGGKSDADALAVILQLLDGNFSLATSSSEGLREEMVGDIASLINSDAFAPVRKNVLKLKDGEKFEVKYLESSSNNAKVKYVVGRNEKGLIYSKDGRGNVLEEKLNYSTLLDNRNGGKGVIVAPIEIYGYFMDELDSSEVVKEKYGKDVNNNSIKLTLAEVDKFFSENLNFGISEYNKEISEKVTKIYEESGFVNKIAELEINKHFRIVDNKIELTKEGENLLKDDKDLVELSKQLKECNINPQLAIEAMLNVLYGQPNYRIGVDFNYGYDKESDEYYVAYYNEEQEIQGKNLTKDPALQSAFTYILNNHEILKKINNENDKNYAISFDNLFKQRITDKDGKYSEPYLQYMYRINNGVLPNKIAYSANDTIAQNNIYSLKDKLGLKNISGSSGTISKNMKALGFEIEQFKSMRGAKDVNIGTFLYDYEVENPETKGKDNTQAGKIEELVTIADDTDEIDAAFMFSDSEAATEKWKKAFKAGNRTVLTYEELKEMERTNKQKYDSILKGKETPIIIVGRNSLRGVNFNEIDAKKMFIQTDLYDEELIRQMSGRAGRGSVFEFTVQIYSLQRIERKANKLGLSDDMESLEICRSKSAKIKTTEQGKALLSKKLSDTDKGDLVNAIIKDEDNHLNREVNNGGLSYFNRLYRRIFLKQDLTNRLNGIAEQMSVLNIEQSRNNQIMGEAVKAAQDAINNPMFDVLNEMLKNMSINRETAYIRILQNFGAANNNFVGTVSKIVQTQNKDEIKFSSQDKENLISIAKTQNIDSELKAFAGKTNLTNSEKDQIAKDMAYLLAEDYKYAVLEFADILSKNKNININSEVNNMRPMSKKTRANLQKVFDSAKKRNRISFFNGLNETRDNASVLFDSTGRLIFNTLGVDSQSEMISYCYEDPLQKGMDTMKFALEELTGTELSNEQEQIFKFNLSFQSIKRQLKVGNIIKWTSSIMPIAFICGMFVLSYFVAPVLLSLSALTVPVILAAFAMVVAAIYIKRYTDRINSAVNQQDNANIAQYGNTPHLRSGLRNVLSSVINQNLNAVMTFGLAGGTLAVIAGVAMLVIGTAPITIPLIALTLTITPVLLISVGFIALAFTIFTQGLFILKNRSKLQEQPSTIQEETQKNTSDTVSGVITSGIALALGMLAVAGMINPVTAVIAGVALIGSFMYAQYGVTANQGKDVNISLKHFAFGILCTLGFASVIILPMAIPAVASFLAIVGIANPLTSFLLIASVVSSFLFPFAVKNFVEFENYKNGGFSRLVKDLLKNNRMTVFLAAPFISVAILFVSFNIPVFVIGAVVVGSFFAGYYISRDSFLEKNEGKVKFLFSIITILLGGIAFMRPINAADNSTANANLDTLEQDSEVVSSEASEAVTEEYESEKSVVTTTGGDEKQEGTETNEQLDQISQATKEVTGESETGKVTEQTDENKENADKISTMKQETDEITEQADENKEKTDKSDTDSADNITIEKTEEDETVEQKEEDKTTEKEEEIKKDENKTDESKGSEQKESETKKDETELDKLTEDLKNSGYTTKINSETGVLTIKKGDFEIKLNDTSKYDKGDIDEIYTEYNNLSNNEYVKDNGYKIKYDNKRNDGSFIFEDKKNNFSMKINPLDENYDKTNTDHFIKNYSSLTNEGYDINLSNSKTGKFTISKSGVELEGYLFDKNFDQDGFDHIWNVKQALMEKYGLDNSDIKAVDTPQGFYFKVTKDGKTVNVWPWKSDGSKINYNSDLNNLFGYGDQIGSGFQNFFYGLFYGIDSDTDYGFGYNSNSGEYYGGGYSVESGNDYTEVTVMSFEDVCKEVGEKQGESQSALSKRIEKLIKDLNDIPGLGEIVKNGEWQKREIKVGDNEVKISYVLVDSKGDDVITIEENDNGTGYVINFSTTYKYENGKEIDISLRYDLMDKDIDVKKDILSLGISTKGNEAGDRQNLVINYKKGETFIEEIVDGTTYRKYFIENLPDSNEIFGFQSKDWIGCLDGNEDTFSEMSEMEYVPNEKGEISDQTKNLIELINNIGGKHTIRIKRMEDYYYDKQELEKYKDNDIYNQLKNFYAELDKNPLYLEIMKACGYSLYTESYSFNYDNSNNFEGIEEKSDVDSITYGVDWKNQRIYSSSHETITFAKGDDTVVKDYKRVYDFKGNIMQEIEYQNGLILSATIINSYNRYGIGLDSVKLTDFQYKKDASGTPVKDEKGHYILESATVNNVGSYVGNGYFETLSSTGEATTEQTFFYLINNVVPKEMTIDLDSDTGTINTSYEECVDGIVYRDSTIEGKNSKGTLKTTYSVLEGDLDAIINKIKSSNRDELAEDNTSINEILSLANPQIITFNDYSDSNTADSNTQVGASLPGRSFQYLLEKGKYNVNDYLPKELKGDIKNAEVNGVLDYKKIGDYLFVNERVENTGTENMVVYKKNMNPLFDTSNTGATESVVNFVALVDTFSGKADMSQILIVEKFMSQQPIYEAYHVDGLKYFEIYSKSMKDTPFGQMRNEGIGELAVYKGPVVFASADIDLTLIEESNNSIFSDIENQSDFFLQEAIKLNKLYEDGDYEGFQNNLNQLEQKGVHIVKLYLNEEIEKINGEDKLNIYYLEYDSPFTDTTDDVANAQMHGFKYTFDVEAGLRESRTKLNEPADWLTEPFNFLGTISKFANEHPYITVLSLGTVALYSSLKLWRAKRNINKKRRNILSNYGATDGIDKETGTVLPKEISSVTREESKEKTSDKFLETAYQQYSRWEQDSLPEGRAKYTEIFANEGKLKEFIEEYNKDKKNEDKIDINAGEEAIELLVKSTIDTVAKTLDIRSTEPGNMLYLATYMHIGLGLSFDAIKSYFDYVNKHSQTGITIEQQLRKIKMIYDESSDLNFSDLPKELIDLMNLFGLFDKEDENYKDITEFTLYDGKNITKEDIEIADRNLRTGKLSDLDKNIFNMISIKTNDMIRPTLGAQMPGNKVEGVRLNFFNYNSQKQMFINPKFVGSILDNIENFTKINSEKIENNNLTSAEQKTITAVDPVVFYRDHSGLKGILQFLSNSSLISVIGILSGIFAVSSAASMFIVFGSIALAAGVFGGVFLISAIAIFALSRARIWLQSNPVTKYYGYSNKYENIIEDVSLREDISTQKKNIIKVALEYTAPKIVWNLLVFTTFIQGIKLAYGITSVNTILSSILSIKVVGLGAMLVANPVSLIFLGILMFASAFLISRYADLITVSDSNLIYKLVNKISPKRADKLIASKTIDSRIQKIIKVITIPAFIALFIAFPGPMFLAFIGLILFGIFYLENYGVFSIISAGHMLTSVLRDGYFVSRNWNKMAETLGYDKALDYKNLKNSDKAKAADSIFNSVDFKYWLQQCSEDTYKVFEDVVKEAEAKNVSLGSLLYNEKGKVVNKNLNLILMYYAEQRNLSLYDMTERGNLSTKQLKDYTFKFNKDMTEIIAFPDLSKEPESKNTKKEIWEGLQNNSIRVNQESMQKYSIRNRLSSLFNGKGSMTPHYAEPIYYSIDELNNTLMVDRHSEFSHFWNKHPYEALNFLSRFKKDTDGTIFYYNLKENKWQKLNEDEIAAYEQFKNMFNADDLSFEKGKLLKPIKGKNIEGKEDIIGYENFSSDNIIIKDLLRIQEREGQNLSETFVGLINEIEARIFNIEKEAEILYETNENIRKEYENKGGLKQYKADRVKKDTKILNIISSQKMQDFAKEYSSGNLSQPIILGWENLLKEVKEKGLENLFIITTLYNTDMDINKYLKLRRSKNSLDKQIADNFELNLVASFGEGIIEDINNYEKGNLTEEQLNEKYTPNENNTFTVSLKEVSAKFSVGGIKYEYEEYTEDDVKVLRNKEKNGMLSVLEEDNLNFIKAALERNKQNGIGDKEGFVDGKIGCISCKEIEYNATRSQIDNAVTLKDKMLSDLNDAIINYEATKKELIQKRNAFEKGSKEYEFFDQLIGQVDEMIRTANERIKNIEDDTVSSDIEKQIKSKLGNDNFNRFKELINKRDSETEFLSDKEQKELEQYYNVLGEDIKINMVKVSAFPLLMAEGKVSQQIYMSMLFPYDIRALEQKDMNMGLKMSDAFYTPVTSNAFDDPNISGVRLTERIRTERTVVGRGNALQEGAFNLLFSYYADMGIIGDYGHSTIRPRDLVMLFGVNSNVVSEDFFSENNYKAMGKVLIAGGYGNEKTREVAIDLFLTLVSKFAGGTENMVSQGLSSHEVNKAKFGKPMASVVDFIEFFNTHGTYTRDIFAILYISLFTIILLGFGFSPFSPFTYPALLAVMGLFVSQTGILPGIVGAFANEYEPWRALLDLLLAIPTSVAQTFAQGDSGERGIMGKFVHYVATRGVAARGLGMREEGFIVKNIENYRHVLSASIGLIAIEFAAPFLGGFHTGYILSAVVMAIPFLAMFGRIVMTPGYNLIEYDRDTVKEHISGEIKAYRELRSKKLRDDVYEMDSNSLYGMLSEKAGKYGIKIESEDKYTREELISELENIHNKYERTRINRATSVAAIASLIVGNIAVAPIKFLNRYIHPAMTMGVVLGIIALAFGLAFMLPSFIIIGSGLLGISSIAGLIYFIKNKFFTKKIVYSTDAGNFNNDDSNLTNRFYENETEKPEMVKLAQQQKKSSDEVLKQEKINKDVVKTSKKEPKQQKQKKSDTIALSQNTTASIRAEINKMKEDEYGKILYKINDSNFDTKTKEKLKEELDIKLAKLVAQRTQEKTEKEPSVSKAESDKDYKQELKELKRAKTLVNEFFDLFVEKKPEGNSDNSDVINKIRDAAEEVIKSPDVLNVNMLNNRFFELNNRRLSKKDINNLKKILKEIESKINKKIEGYPNEIKKEVDKELKFEEGLQEIRHAEISVWQTPSKDSVNTFKGKVDYVVNMNLSDEETLKLIEELEGVIKELNYRFYISDEEEGDNLAAEEANERIREAIEYAEENLKKIKAKKQEKAEMPIYDEQAFNAFLNKAKELEQEAEQLREKIKQDETIKDGIQANYYIPGQGLIGDILSGINEVGDWIKTSFVGKKKTETEKVDYKEGKKVITTPSKDYGIGDEKQQKVIDEKEDKFVATTGETIIDENAVIKLVEQDVRKVDEKEDIKDKAKEMIIDYFYPFMKDAVKQTVNPVTPVAVKSAEISTNFISEEIKDAKKLEGFKFNKNADGRTKTFIRGSNITVKYKNKDINFKIGVTSDIDSYNFIVTVIGESKKEYNKLSEQEQKEIVKFAQAEYLDRLDNDSHLRDILFEKIYGVKFFGSQNYRNMYLKFCEEIKLEKEKSIYSDVNIRQKFSVSTYSIIEAPIKKSTNYYLKTRLSTAQLVRLKDDAGYNTIDLIVDGQSDTVVKNEIIRLRNLGFDVNLVVTVDDNSNVEQMISYINKFNNLTGIKFDISKIKNIEGKDTNKMINEFIKPVVSGINFVMPDINIKFGDNIDNVTLENISKTNYSITLNENGLDKLNSQYKYLFNTFIENGKIEIEYNEDANITEAKAKKLVAMGINAISVMKYSFTKYQNSKAFQYSNKIKVSYNAGISIGKDAFVDVFDINDFSEILTKENYTLADFNKWYSINKNKLSKKMQTEIELILTDGYINNDENDNNGLRIKSIKQLFAGAIEMTLEEELAKSISTSNDMKEVLNALSNNERKVVRYLLVQAKISGIELSYAETIKIFSQMSLPDIRNTKQGYIDSILKILNSADIMFKNDITVEEERNIKETLDILLKFGDILVSERNAENILEDTMNTSVEGIKDLLSAA